MTIKIYFHPTLKRIVIIYSNRRLLRPLLNLLGSCRNFLDYPKNTRLYVLDASLPVGDRGIDDKFFDI